AAPPSFFGTGPFPPFAGCAIAPAGSATAAASPMHWIAVRSVNRRPIVIHAPKRLALDLMLVPLAHRCIARARERRDLREAESREPEDHAQTERVRGRPYPRQFGHAAADR